MTTEEQEYLGTFDDYSLGVCWLKNEIIISIWSRSLTEGRIELKRYFQSKDSDSEKRIGELIIEAGKLSDIRMCADPNRGKQEFLPLYKSLHFSSYEEFHKKIIYARVHRWKDKIKFTPTRGKNHLSEKALYAPADASPEEIGRLVKEALSLSEPANNLFNAKYFPERCKPEYLAKVSGVALAEGPVSMEEAILWFAVKSKDAKAVAGFLRLRDMEEMKWENVGEEMREMVEKFIPIAISRDQAAIEAYKKENNKVFVAPAMKGWVLVVADLLSLVEEPSYEKVAKGLSEAFGEAQCFLHNARHPMVSWIWMKKGKVKRYFGPTDGEALGEPEGEITSGEKKVLEYAGEPQEEWFPDSEDVFKVAGVWSLDPSQFSPGYPEPVGPGWIGTWPG